MKNLIKMKMKIVEIITFKKMKMKKQTTEILIN